MTDSRLVMTKVPSRFFARLVSERFARCGSLSLPSLQVTWANGKPWDSQLSSTSFSLSLLTVFWIDLYGAGKCKSYYVFKKVVMETLI